MPDQGTLDRQLTAFVPLRTISTGQRPAKAVVIADMTCGAVFDDGAMRSLRLPIAALVLLLVAAPLVAQDSRSRPEPIIGLDYDVHADFEKYRTYSWVPVRSGVDPEDYERARGLIDRALAARFTRADPGDFAISISGVEAETGDLRGSYHSSRGLASFLVVDIYHTTTKRPIWNGLVRSVPGDLSAAVDRLMKRFPPSHGCDPSPAGQFLERCPG